MIQFYEGQGVVGWWNRNKGRNGSQPVIQLSLLILKELPPELDSGSYVSNGGVNRQDPLDNQVRIMVGVRGSFEDMTIQYIQGDKWVLAPKIHQIQNIGQLLLRKPTVHPPKNCNGDNELTRRRLNKAIDDVSSRPQGTRNSTTTPDVCELRLQEASNVGIGLVFGVKEEIDGGIRCVGGEEVSDVAFGATGYEDPEWKEGILREGEEDMKNFDLIVFGCFRRLAHRVDIVLHSDNFVQAVDDDGLWPAHPAVLVVMNPPEGFEDETPGLLLHVLAEDIRVVIEGRM